MRLWRMSRGRGCKCKIINFKRRLEMIAQMCLMKKNELLNPVDPGTCTLFSLGDAQTGYEMCFLTTGISWPY